MQRNGKFNLFFLTKSLIQLILIQRNLIVLQILIKKIISNADAANKLIFEGHIKEAKIVLRSAVESVILITYLSQFQKK